MESHDPLWLIIPVHVHNSTWKSDYSSKTKWNLFSAFQQLSLGFQSQMAHCQIKAAVLENNY